MDSLFVQITPLITQFTHSEAFIVFIMGLITTVLGYYKVPKWIVTAIQNIIKALIHAPANVELESIAAKEHNKVFTSSEKLDAAIGQVNKMLKPKEKKLLNVITLGKGAGWAIEHLVLPGFQMFWKLKK